jgi:hypothetical protein
VFSLASIDSDQLRAIGRNRQLERDELLIAALHAIVPASSHFERCRFYAAFRRHLTGAHFVFTKPYDQSQNLHYSPFVDSLACRLQRR